MGNKLVKIELDVYNEKEYLVFTSKNSGYEWQCIFIGNKKDSLNILKAFEKIGYVNEDKED